MTQRNTALAIGIAALTMSTVNPKVIYDEIEEDWNLYKITYNKSYADDHEDAYRKNVYLANKLKIDKHNKLYDNGEVTFTIGMNRFGDWTGREFFERMIGYKPRLSDIDRNNTFVRSQNVKYPVNMNWVKRGYVTPVKDQKQCGAYWAFSAIGSLEGQYFKKSKRLVSLSEQNLIDCSKDYGNHGCGDGQMIDAFQYIIDNGGINTEKSYPYNGKKVGAMVSSYRSVEGDDNLLAAVATVGPVSVRMNAIKSFHLYKQGIYQDRDCSTGDTNYALLVVGYGVNKDGAKYWLVKNSWGTSWGVKSFAYISRDVDSMCGISQEASYPVV